MKYIIVTFFICLVLGFFSLHSNLEQISGLNYNYQNISSNQIAPNNNEIPINDSFSIDGSLISVILPKQVLDSGDNASNTNDNITNNSEDNNAGHHNIDISSNISKLRNPQSFIPNITNAHTNKSNNLSDNLVSLLSGIIIESIHNGNPTLNNINNSDNHNSNNNVKLISGKWSLRVQNGMVLDFNGKFQMISADGTGSHWYSIKNFNSKEKLFFDKDKSAAIYGTIDFTTDNDSLKKTSNLLLTINNLEVIQLTLFDKNLSDLFHGIPIYGTIDSIKIKN
ncbi:MAG TPA: hypothetical protein VN704_05055 [Verrucomicrobiae bacterium]|nr:hypothetical protein [Verrucomicrobiae bacterium]